MTKVKMSKEDEDAAQSGAYLLPSMTRDKIPFNYLLSPEFVEKRRAALERYLNRTAGHPNLRVDPDFR